LRRTHVFYYEFKNLVNMVTQRKGGHSGRRRR
jgi:hypothetical protein